MQTAETPPRHERALRRRSSGGGGRREGGGGSEHLTGAETPGEGGTLHAVNVVLLGVGARQEHPLDGRLLVGPEPVHAGGLAVQRLRDLHDRVPRRLQALRGGEQSKDLQQAGSLTKGSSQGQRTLQFANFGAEHRGKNSGVRIMGGNSPRRAPRDTVTARSCRSSATSAPGLGQRGTIVESAKK